MLSCASRCNFVMATTDRLNVNSYTLNQNLGELLANCSKERIQTLLPSRDVTSEGCFHDISSKAITSNTTVDRMPHMTDQHNTSNMYDIWYIFRRKYVERCLKLKSCRQQKEKKNNWNKQTESNKQATHKSWVRKIISSTTWFQITTISGLRVSRYCPWFVQLLFNVLYRGHFWTSVIPTWFVFLQIRYSWEC